MQIYNITPVPAPRMTRSDKWKKRPVVLKHFAFRDECKLKKITVKSGDSIIFVLPMPKSWSKKKKAEYDSKPHEQKPDLDNLCKSLLDAIYEDDSHIHTLNLKKIWGYDGKIIIE